MNEFHNLSLEELQTLAKKINDEIDRKRTEEKREMWGNIFYAITKYINTFGNIIVRTYEEDYELSPSLDLCTTGIINLREDEEEDE